MTASLLDPSLLAPDQPDGSDAVTRATSVPRQPRVLGRPDTRRRVQPPQHFRRPGSAPTPRVPTPWREEVLTRAAPAGLRGPSRGPLYDAPDVEVVRTPVELQPESAPQLRRRETTVHLTRRGRLAVLVMSVLAVAVSMAVVLGAIGSISAGTPAPTSTQTVVVSTGETLWTIAQRVAPGEDPRPVIDQIVDLNDLGDAGAVRVGQQLEVPRY